MLMTTIVKDSIERISKSAQEGIGKGLLQTLLYADEALLVGASNAYVQELLDSVLSVGSKYGMQLHWSKFQLLAVNGKCKFGFMS